MRYAHSPHPGVLHKYGRLARCGVRHRASLDHRLRAEQSRSAPRLPGHQQRKRAPGRASRRISQAPRFVAEFSRSALPIRPRRERSGRRGSAVSGSHSPRPRTHLAARRPRSRVPDDGALRRGDARIRGGTGHGRPRRFDSHLLRDGSDRQRLTVQRARQSGRRPEIPSARARRDQGAVAACSGDERLGQSCRTSEEPGIARQS